MEELTHTLARLISSRDSPSVGDAASIAREVAVLHPDVSIAMIQHFATEMIIDRKQKARRVSAHTTI